jgi:hypothetical protein
MNDKTDYLDNLIEAYHTNHPDAETPLNYIEMLGVDALISIMEEASDKSFEIEFDYSIPQQPKSVLSR